MQTQWEKDRHRKDQKDGDWSDTSSDNGRNRSASGGRQLGFGSRGEGERPAWRPGGGRDGSPSMAPTDTSLDALLHGRSGDGNDGVDGDQGDRPAWGYGAGHMEDVDEYDSQPYDTEGRTRSAEDRRLLKKGTGLGGRSLGAGMSEEDRAARAALRKAREDARQREEAEIARRQAERRQSMLRRGGGSGGGKAGGGMMGGIQEDSQGAEGGDEMDGKEGKEGKSGRGGKAVNRLLVRTGMYSNSFRCAPEELKRRAAIDEKMKQARRAQEREEEEEEAARRSARRTLKKGAGGGGGTGRLSGKAGTKKMPSSSSSSQHRTLDRADSLYRLDQQEAKLKAMQAELDAKRARIKQATLKKGSGRMGGARRSTMGVVDTAMSTTAAATAADKVDKVDKDPRRHSEMADDALRERFQQRSRRRRKRAKKRGGGNNDGASLASLEWTEEASSGSDGDTGGDGGRGGGGGGVKRRGNSSGRKKRVVKSSIIRKDLRKVGAMARTSSWIAANDQLEREEGESSTIGTRSTEWVREEQKEGMLARTSSWIAVKGGGAAPVLSAPVGANAGAPSHNKRSEGKEGEGKEEGEGVSSLTKIMCDSIGERGGYDGGKNGDDGGGGDSSDSDAFSDIIEENAAGMISVYLSTEVEDSDDDDGETAGLDESTDDGGGNGGQGKEREINDNDNDNDGNDAGYSVTIAPVSSYLDDSRRRGSTGSRLSLASEADDEKMEGSTCTAPVLVGRNSPTMGSRMPIPSRGTRLVTPGIHTSSGVVKTPVLVAAAVGRGVMGSAAIGASVEDPMRRQSGTQRASLSNLRQDNTGMNMNTKQDGMEKDESVPKTDMDRYAAQAMRMQEMMGVGGDSSRNAAPAPRRSSAYAGRNTAPANTGSGRASSGVGSRRQSARASSGSARQSMKLGLPSVVNFGGSVTGGHTRYV